MIQAANSNQTRALADSVCFLCEAVGTPTIIAGCTNENTITICSAECARAHGVPMLITNNELSRAWI